MHQDYLKQVGRKASLQRRTQELHLIFRGEVTRLWRDWKDFSCLKFALGVTVQEYWWWHPFQVHGDEPGCCKHLGKTEFFRKHRSGVHRPSGTASSEEAPKIQWWCRWMITSTSSTCEWMTSSLRLGFRFKRRREGDKVFTRRAQANATPFRDVNHTHLQQAPLKLSEIMNEQTVLSGLECHVYGSRFTGRKMDQDEWSSW